MAKVRSNHGRAMEDVVALVGHARPQLVDAWDALAVLEANGYTDARVQRELGLNDTRELADEVFVQLSARPLPVAPAADPSARAAGNEAPLLRSTLATAIGWIAALFALGFVLPVPAPLVRIALFPSVIVSCGFVEAARRRGVFYTSMGQPALGRIACWYFMRLAAFAVAGVLGAGVWLCRAVGAGWPQIALWADAFVIASALWLVAGAAQVPGVLSRRRVEANTVPIPRMTVVVYRELPVLLTTSVLALVFAMALDYAAVDTVVGSGVTFVLATIAGRWTSRTRPVSVS